MAREVIAVAVKVWEDDRERNVRMGDFGAKWILEKSEREGRIEKGGKISVLTVCNTGALATSVSGRESVVLRRQRMLTSCLDAN